MAANWRNWTKPRHSGVAHDIWMEHGPLDVPYGGGQCEYDNINVNDVIMLEIPWLWAVVDGSTLPGGRIILNPTFNPFSLPKHTLQPPPKQPFVTSTMVENIA